MNLPDATDDGQHTFSWLDGTPKQPCFCGAVHKDRPEDYVLSPEQQHASDLVDQAREYVAWFIALPPDEKELERAKAGAALRKWKAEVRRKQRAERAKAKRKWGKRT